jgi:hypothetical protein
MLKPSGGMLKKVFSAPTAFTGARKKPSGTPGGLASGSRFGKSTAGADKSGAVHTIASRMKDNAPAIGAAMPKKKGVFGKAIGAIGKMAGSAKKAGMA